MPIIATEMEVSHGRYLWYGDLGCGKTYLIGMMHEVLKKRGTKGIYMFNFDKGENTLTTAGFDVAFDYFVGRDAYPAFERRLGELSNDNEGYGGYAFDSLTTMEKLIMNHVHKINDVKRHLGFVSNQQDYGILIQIIENLMPFLQELSLNAEVIMTAHLLERRDEDTGKLWFLPSVTGKKLPSKIGLWFNEVWRIWGEKKGDKIERFAQTAAYDKFQCKSQVAGMPLACPVDVALHKAVEAYNLGNALHSNTPN